VDPNQVPPQDGSNVQRDEPLDDSEIEQARERGEAVERDRVEGDSADREVVGVAGTGGAVGAAVGGLAGSPGAVVVGSAGSDAGAAGRFDADEPAEESTDPRPR
jgi:hypothetical protein